MSIDPFDNRKKTSYWKKFKEENILTNFTVMLVPHKSCHQPIHIKLPFGILLGSFLSLCILLCFTSYFAYSSFKLRQVSLENTRLNKISAEQEEQLDKLESLADSIMSDINNIVKKEDTMREKIGIENKNSAVGGVDGQTNKNTTSLLGDSKLHSRLNSLYCSLQDLSYVVDWHKQEIKNLDVYVNEYKEYLDDYDNFLECVPIGWPLTGGEKTTSTFGYRVNPFTGRSRELHTGHDLRCCYAAPVYAAGNGTVVSSRYVVGYGYSVEIDHGYGYRSIYAHCSTLIAKKGDKVKRGDLVAKAGSSGRSTGTHLHFGVSYHGAWINPKSFLDSDLSKISTPEFSLNQH